MLATFSGSVTLSGGRTVLVQPATQIVLVDRRLGDGGVERPGRARRVRARSAPLPMAWHERGAGCGWTTSLLAVEYAREPERWLAGGAA